MTRYKNLNGNSGVDAYDIGFDAIVVRFLDGSQYTYTYESAGPEKVERMKGLAEDGRGLNSYINTDVYYDYADTTYRRRGRQSGRHAGLQPPPKIVVPEAAGPGIRVEAARGSVGGGGGYAKPPFPPTVAPAASSGGRRFASAIGGRIAGFLFRRGGVKKK